MCECPKADKFVVPYEGNHRKVVYALVCTNCDACPKWPNWRVLKHRRAK